MNINVDIALVWKNHLYIYIYVYIPENKNVPRNTVQNYPI